MQITNEMIPIAVALAFFITILLSFLAVMNYLRIRSNKRKLVRKIEASRMDGEIFEKGINQSKKTGGLKNHIIEFFVSLGKRIFPKQSSDYSQLRPKFQKAGFRSQKAASVFWGIKAFLSLCFPIVFFVIMINYPGTLTLPLKIAVCFLLGFSGFLLPDVILNRIISKRSKSIFNAFPDSLDLMAVCVEAGMGLDSSLNRVAEEIEIDSKILSDELKLLNFELRAGKSRKQALEDFAMRSDLDDVRSFTTLLIQADKFGTSIAESLKVYSDTFRTKRYQRAEEIAARLPVKLIFPLVFFIFPSLFVVILGPAVIRIYEALIVSV
jgi:tight adherence protein C